MADWTYVEGDCFEMDFHEVGNSGNGDAITMRYRVGGDETIVMVDGGYLDDGQKLADHMDEYYGAGCHINHVVVTHPDQDHVNGLRYILEHRSVGKLWMLRPWNYIDELIPEFDYEYTEDGLRRRLKKDFPNIAKLEELADAAGVPIGEPFRGSAIGEFVVLAPSKERYLDCVVRSDKTPEMRVTKSLAVFAEDANRWLSNLIFGNWGEENLKGNTEGTSAENEMSVVQIASLADETIMLTGDAGVEGLAEACDRLEGMGIELPLSLDVFQVPHHGGRRNLSSDILDRLLGSKLNALASTSKFTAFVMRNSSDKTHPKKAVTRAINHRGGKVLAVNGVICRRSSNVPSRDGWGAAAPLPYPQDQEPA